jgi:hypothetical protein
MADRVMIQRSFRKALWTCTCGQEDIVDLNVGTPSVYEHNCSACNKWSNSFKEYNGVLSYTPAEYDKVLEEDVTSAKDIAVSKWVYGIKNPPLVQQPTKADLEREKADLEQRVTELTSKISVMTIAEPLEG